MKGQAVNGEYPVEGFYGRVSAVKFDLVKRPSRHVAKLCKDVLIEFGRVPGLRFFPAVKMLVGEDSCRRYRNRSGFACSSNNGALHLASHVAQGLIRKPAWREARTDAIF